MNGCEGGILFSGAWGSGPGRLSSSYSSKRLDIDYATLPREIPIGYRRVRNVDYMLCVRWVKLVDVRGAIAVG